LDRKSLRVLRFINHKSEPVKDFEILKKFGNTVQKNIDYLMDHNFIDSTVYELHPDYMYGLPGKPAFSITPHGQSAIEETFDRSKRFWIPVTISLIALIKSFSGEILLLLQLLGQLMK